MYPHVIDRENKLWKKKTTFDVLYSKQAFLDYENIGFKNAKNWHLSKRVTPWFWWKIWNCVNLSFYTKYTEKKYLVTLLLENKPF